MWAGTCALRVTCRALSLVTRRVDGAATQLLQQLPADLVQSGEFCGIPQGASLSLGGLSVPETIFLCASA